MSFQDLSLAERNHINRAYSQAVYYAHRGLYDALRIHASEISPATRSKITGAVCEFINAYIVHELAQVIAPPSDGLTRIAAPDFDEPILQPSHPTIDILI